MTKRTRTIGFACIILAVACGWYAVSRYVETQWESVVKTVKLSQDDLPAIAKVMKLDFPPSSRVLTAEWSSGFLDEYIELKIEIGAAEFENFFQNSPFAKIAMRSDVPQIGSSSELPGWTPDEVVKFQSAQAWLPEGVVLRGLMDFDQPDKVIVYLHWTHN